MCASFRSSGLLASTHPERVAPAPTELRTGRRRRPPPRACFVAASVSSSCALGVFLGPDTAAARQSLVALGLNSCTKASWPGPPSAPSPTPSRSCPASSCWCRPPIGLRGNIFGPSATGSAPRSTPGRSASTTRTGTVLGQNVLAAPAPTLAMSVVLAVLAKSVAGRLGLSGQHRHPRPGA